MTRSREEKSSDIKPIFYVARTDALFQKDAQLPVTFKIDQKNDQQTRSLFTIAALYGNNDILKQLMAKDEKVSSLAEVFYKDIKYIDLFAENWWKPKFHLPSSALNSAVSMLQIETVKLLLEQKGMDPTAALFDLSNSYQLDVIKQFNPELPEDKYNQTRIEIAQLLLKAGANPNAVLPYQRNLKKDPAVDSLYGFQHLLFVAISRSDVALVELLLPHINDPRIIDMALKLPGYWDDTTVEKDGFIQPLNTIKKTTDLEKLIKLLVEKAEFVNSLPSKSEPPLNSDGIRYSIYQDGAFKDVDKRPYIPYKAADPEIKKKNKLKRSLNIILSDVVSHADNFDQSITFIIQYLVAKGADINKALRESIEKHNLDIFKFCLENGASLKKEHLNRLEGKIKFANECLSYIRKSKPTVEQLIRLKKEMLNCFSMLEYCDNIYLQYLQFINKFLQYLNSEKFTSHVLGKINDLTKLSFDEFLQYLRSEKSLSPVYEKINDLKELLSEVKIQIETRKEKFSALLSSQENPIEIHKKIKEEISEKLSEDDINKRGDAICYFIKNMMQTEVAKLFGDHEFKDEEIEKLITLYKNQNTDKLLAIFKDPENKSYGRIALLFMTKNDKELLSAIEGYSVKEFWEEIKPQKESKEIVKEKENSRNKYNKRNRKGHFSIEITKSIEAIREALRNLKKQDALKKWDQFLGLASGETEFTDKLFDVFVDKCIQFPGKIFSKSDHKTQTEEVKKPEIPSEIKFRDKLSNSSKLLSNIPADTYELRMKVLPNNKLLIANKEGNLIYIWNGNQAKIAEEIKPNPTATTMLIINSLTGEKEVIPLSRYYEDFIKLNSSGIYLKTEKWTREFSLCDINGKEISKFTLPEHAQGSIWGCIPLDQGRFLISTANGIYLFQCKDNQFTFLNKVELESQDGVGWVIQNPTIMPYQGNQFFILSNTLTLWEITDKNEFKFIKRAPELPFELGRPFEFKSTALSHNRIATFNNSMCCGKWNSDLDAYEDWGKFGKLARELLCIWDTKELKPISIIKFDKKIQEIRALPNEDQLAIVLEGDPNVHIISISASPKLTLEKDSKEMAPVVYHCQNSVLFHYKNKAKKSDEAEVSQQIEASHRKILSF